MPPLSSPPRSATPAAWAGSEDFLFLLYGQAAALSRALPAAELMRVLVAEATALLRR